MITVGEVVDIEAAGGHVGGYEDWKHPVAEFFITMSRCCWERSPWSASAL